MHSVAIDGYAPYTIRGMRLPDTRYAPTDGMSRMLDVARIKILQLAVLASCLGTAT